MYRQARHSHCSHYIQRELAGEPKRHGKPLIISILVHKKEARPEAPDRGASVIVLGDSLTARIGQIVQTRSAAVSEFTSVFGPEIPQ
jgi:hypothetical protein